MRTSRMITFILGIFMILTGIYCLFNPAMTYMTLGYVVGINMIVDAVGGIILWHDKENGQWRVFSADRLFYWLSTA